MLYGDYLVPIDRDRDGTTEDIGGYDQSLSVFGLHQEAFDSRKGPAQHPDSLAGPEVYGRLCAEAVKNGETQISNTYVSYRLRYVPEADDLRDAGSGEDGEQFAGIEAAEDIACEEGGFHRSDTVRVLPLRKIGRGKTVITC